jgi:predicted flap endonuclease-1-like 5' DNA nuclease
MPHYKIEDLEGIGPTYAKKLRKTGITSVNSFLKRTHRRKGRRELAAETKLKEPLILKWANMADLYRVKGIGSEYAELLEKAGVDTVKELSKRSPEKLHAKLVEVNARGRGRVRVQPGLKRVESWVRQAKRMKPMVTY